MGAQTLNRRTLGNWLRRVAKSFQKNHRNDQPEKPNRTERGENGAVFLIDAKTQDEARAVMETLPLSKEHLIDHEYIPIGPLIPLMGLMGAGARQ
jgi:hypothetical protein